MDKQIIRKALDNYADTLVKLNNNYTLSLASPDVDISELDRTYDRRVDNLVENFIKEISGPVLKLIEEKTVSVYEYKDNFCVEVNKNENKYSAWLYLKRSNFNFPKMFLVTWENDTEEDFLTNLLEYLNNTDDIQTYKELYVCEDEWGE